MKGFSDRLIFSESKRNSLSRQIQFTIAIVATTLVLLQSIVLGVLLNRNQENQKAYIDGMVKAIAVSLDTVGQNLEGMGSFITTYPAFQDLYIDKERSAESYADATATVRFLTTYVPIVEEVIVVDTNRIPTGYYSVNSYDIIDRIEERYSFINPKNTKKGFLFWDDIDKFVYVAPISKSYSSYSVDSKSATAVLVCDLGYIESIIKDNSTGQETFITISDINRKTIISNASKEEGKDEIIAEEFAKEMNLKIKAMNISGNFNNVTWMLLWFFICSVAVIIIVSTLMIAWLRKRIISPVSTLAKDIVEDEEDYLKKRISPIDIQEIDTIIESFNQVLDENELATTQMISAKEKLYESELRQTQAEFYALQSQINPHFLYNTLQCVRSIALMRDVQEIADISLAMSDLFRYGTEGSELVYLEDEIDIVRKYELITKIRFQNRFEFINNIDESLMKCRMIKMLVQPLVENAVFHGVSQKAEGGIIELNVIRKEDEIYIEVRDNGPGFSEERRKDIDRALEQEFHDKLSETGGKYLGLYNINRRIKLHYGESFGLAISREGNFTVVSIAFPLLW